MAGRNFNVVPENPLHCHVAALYNETAVDTVTNILDKSAFVGRTGRDKQREEKESYRLHTSDRRSTRLVYSPEAFSLGEPRRHRTRGGGPAPLQLLLDNG